MKRTLTLLITLFLCMSIFTACVSNEVSQNSGGPTESSPAVPPASEQDNASSATNNPQTSDATYFIIGGNLVGSWENGSWRSLNDPGGRYENQYSNDFYFKDVLSSPRFTLYSKNGRIGCSDFALINGGAGVSGFEDGDKTGLFAPYANPDPGNLWPFSMEIKLPAAFGPELGDVKIPVYGYALRFSYENIDLATSSRDDLNPCGKVEWQSNWAEQWGYSTLQELLGENGIHSEPHVDYTAKADMDGDGEQEVLLFAGTPRDEMGYQKVSPEDGGIYSVILLCRADGSSETVFERFLQYTSDVTAYFNLRPSGVFDLNGDGEYEICAVMGEWEWGHTFVLSRDADGKWETVLRANWGT